MGGLMDDRNYKIYVNLLQSNEAALRCFIRSLMPSWNDVDDVMQEVSLVLWEKFEEFDQDSHFLKWAYVVARFKVMNFQSKKGREKLQFDDELMELMAQEIEVEEDLRKTEEKALWDCMHNLTSGRRQLLLKTSQKGVTIKSLAEKMGKTPKSLYRTIDRIKVMLQQCIRQKLLEEGLS
jgi:RNA polymerase sigma-70 factor (ECF subfamily)